MNHQLFAKLPGITDAVHALIADNGGSKEDWFSDAELVLSNYTEGMITEVEKQALQAKEKGLLSDMAASEHTEVQKLADTHQWWDLDMFFESVFNKEY